VVLTPSGGVHRCPGCGAGRAERRTPRSGVERLRATLTGRRPYRCLGCGRRFYDRPANSALPEAAAPASATLDPPPQRRRQAYWRVDVRQAGSRPAEISLLVLMALIAGAIAAGLVLLLWPEGESVVRSAY
jgi:hypothetical protein